MVERVCLAAGGFGQHTAFAPAGQRRACRRVAGRQALPCKEIEISAPVEIAFETMLDVLGPEGQMFGGKPFPMKIELWPGGRWYRDLGKNSGHLWGHVHVIKPPALLEFGGPLMMSYAAANYLQYRLKEEGDVTRLTFVHSAMRFIMPIMPEHRDGLPEGWQYWLERICELVERKAHRSHGR